MRPCAASPSPGGEDTEVAQEVADVDHPGRRDRDVDRRAAPVRTNGMAARTPTAIAALAGVLKVWLT